MAEEKGILATTPRGTAAILQVRLWCAHGSVWLVSEKPLSHSRARGI